MKIIADTTERGVRDREFRIMVEGRTVPGVLWTPEGAAGPRPLVVLGHGGGLHKRAEYISALAHRFVRHHRYAALAIDGIDHGDRRPDGGRDFATVWAERTRARQAPRMGVTDEMVADTQGAVAAVRALSEVGDSGLGYWGLSMGTIYGLPYVAAEPATRVAVLGLMGIAPAEATDPWQAMARERLGGDAPRITCPTCFIVQSDDELVPRDNALRLFDMLGAKDRRLHLNPGAHAAVPREEMDFSEAFISRHLGTVET
jgi:dienelactone hydrolase